MVIPSVTHGAKLEEREWATVEARSSLSEEHRCTERTADGYRRHQEEGKAEDKNEGGGQSIEHALSESSIQRRP